MRTHTFALIASLAFGAAASAGAQVPPTPPTPETPRVPKPPRVESWERAERGRVEETDRKTLTVGNAVEVDLSNISGDITVVPGGGRDAVIEYTRRGFGDSPEEAKRQLEMITVTLTVIGEGRGEVRSRYKVPPGHRERNFRSSVDFRVTAPPQTRIRVKSISGNIQASKMKGDLALESISGNIRIDYGGRVSLAKTVSGNVDISGLTAEEPVTASSMSGTVTLRALKARYVDLNSISGDIVVKDVACERAELQTISGSVDYAGAITRSGRYQIKAHSGDIRLAVTGGSGFDIEANSFSGRIRSDLPIKNEAVDEEEAAVVAGRTRVRIPRRAMFRGTYKDGSAVIELTTFSGDIVITK
jgi:DUF4097 and DUF4098 domain-containing protein YvlB